MWDYYDIKKERKPIPPTMTGNRRDTGGSDRNELRELMNNRGKKRTFGTGISSNETNEKIAKEFEKVIEDITSSRNELKRLVQQMSPSEDVHKAIKLLKTALEHLR